jgi:hypothetical protein
VAKVTLQINLAPLDARFAPLLLEHQMRQCGRFADEVLLTLDLRLPGRSLELRDVWDKGADDLMHVVQTYSARYPNVRYEPVDLSDKVAADMAVQLFGGRRVPQTDFRGRPFYAYFYGLYSAANDYVLHLDSDMMLGGGSSTWFDEAIAVLTERREIFTCSPFPGPPRADFRLTTQVGQPVPGQPDSYHFDTFSSRVYFVDRRNFRDKTPPRVTLPQRWRDVPRAAIFRRPMVGPAEDAVGSAMRRSGCRRLDFLGQSPGLWSLHPPYRSDRFYSMLPDLLEMVESGSVPDGQRGDYDLNESVIDWSDAIAAHRAMRWHR